MILGHLEVCVSTSYFDLRQLNTCQRVRIHNKICFCNRHSPLSSIVLAHQTQKQIVEQIQVNNKKVQRRSILPFVCRVDDGVSKEEESPVKRRCVCDAFYTDSDWTASRSQRQIQPIRMWHSVYPPL